MNIENLCNRGFSIIHCASDTSFAEKDRARVMRSNVESLTEILNFAHESKTPCFHFISTAYAAGSDRIECPEAQINTAHFTNVYEESKARAESIVSGRCQEVGSHIPLYDPQLYTGILSQGDLSNLMHSITQSGLCRSYGIYILRI